MDLAKKIAKERSDRQDSEWQDEFLLVRLFSLEYLDTLIILTNAAKKLVANQPTLPEVSAPCRVFGDLHGQFRDLLLLFKVFGAPDDTGPIFVFNGDFVDRGVHQLAVIGLLAALKVALPQRVWLVRGNHEDRYMNERYGFQQECHKSLGLDFGPKVFELMQRLFDCLPLAVMVSGRVLVVHGGIGDGNWQLDDLRKVKRPLGVEQLEDPSLSWLYNIMWSDPIEDDDPRRQGVFGVHESPRGHAATNFAWNVTKTFCARNGLSLIVRSHQSKRGSLGFDIMHEHMLVRIFSARDYEGHGNDGAVLLISPGADDLLTVRPQVMRSVTKARTQAAADFYSS